MARAWILAAAALAVVAVAQADSKRDELDRFQGKWRVERIEENGVAEPDGEAKRFTLTIKGGLITVEMNGRTETTAFKIDPEPTPRQIDLMPQYGDDKGKTFKGIYEIDGDVLRICATPKAERPKKIVSEAGTVLLVLKRAKD